MKRAVTVQIAGQKLGLRSDADEASVREIAAYVDARIRDVQRQGKAADTQAIVVLAALQIAEELFNARRLAAEQKLEVSEARRALTDLKRRVRDKSRSLLDFLEREARV